MGRRPQSPNAIPRLRVRRKPSGNVCYYYDHGGKPRRETPLGSDYGLAVKAWAELEHAGMERVREVITFRYVADQYRAKVIPGKAPRTQKDNLIELAKLIEFFDDPPGPLDDIEPQNVAQYMKWRQAKTRAIREKALLSHLWNWARGEGYTKLPNPCAGVRVKKSPGRDVYVEDDEFQAIYAKATQPVRDAMDLLYLTGQRPSDVLAATEHQIRDKRLHFKQAKTGKRVPMDMSDRLESVLERIRARKQTHKVYCTRLVVNMAGRPLSLQMLQRGFSEARKAAGVTVIQLRDLRAKAGTDKLADSGSMRQAQQQLGHSNIAMTEHYLRNRRGDATTPTK